MTDGTVVDETSSPPEEPGRRPRWWRRHKALTVLLTFALVLALVVGGWVVHLNGQIGDIPRFQVETGDRERPARITEGGENILLLGTDDPAGGGGVFDMLESGDWEPGRFRSDAILVLHLNRDREQAQLISIPRDSYVPIEGHGRNKINAAFSFGGPGLMVRTVEELTETRIDHTVVIDFNHFVGLTDAVGGVDIHEGGTRRDMQGEEALEYVRARKSLPNGDFDRVKRQQNFMRAMMRKLISRGVVTNPVRLTRVVGELTDTVAVDDSLTSGRIRSLALSSRGLRPNRMRFVTVPHEGTDEVDDAGSIVRLDAGKIRTMFEAVASDSFETWYADHDVEELEGEDQVN